MTKLAHFRNGMGDKDTGTGAEEDDLLYMSNYFLAGTAGGVVDTDDLEVTERGAGADKSVDVAAGKCFIPNASYVVNTDGETKLYAALSTATENVTIADNTSGNDRIDLIYAKINEATAPGDEAVDVLEIDVEQGTPSGSPVAPATPANSIPLAEVAVANGFSSIVDANITDVRTYAQVDGAKVVDLPYSSVKDEEWTENSSGSLFTTSGGGEDIGSGSILSRYVKRGKVCDWQFYISFAADTNFGSGDFRFTAPFTAASYPTRITGIARIFDNNTSTDYLASVTMAASATFVTLKRDGDTLSIRQGTPITFATSDSIGLSLTFPTA